jgi:hypothetical protein
MEIKLMTEKEIAAMSEVGGYVESITEVLNRYEPSRFAGVVIHKLEEALMWFNQLLMHELQKSAQAEQPQEQVIVEPEIVEEDQGDVNKPVAE